MRKFIVVAVILMFAVPFFTMAGSEKETPAPVTEEPAVQVEQVQDADGVDPWIKAQHEKIEGYKGEIAFKGPAEQTPGWATSLELTNAEVAEVRKGNYKIVIPWWAQEGEYVLAMGKGIEDAAAHLGMEIIAESNTNFDPLKLQTDVETMMALDPDICIVLPTDTITAAQSLKPLVDNDKELVLISNLPDGYIHGRDYVGITTSMPYNSAKSMVKIIAEEVGKDAKVALVYHAADFWITNFQDGVVKETILNEYPEMEIVAEEGFINPADTTTIVAGIIQRHPEVEAMYISFNTACVGALAAVEEADRDDIGLVTVGVSLPLLINLIEGGNMIGLLNDTAYNIGVNCAILGAYGVLGKSAPEYTVSPSAAYVSGMTTEELIDVWRVTYNIPLPETLTKALTK